MKHVLCFAVLFTIFTQAVAHAGELPGLRRALETVPQSVLSSEALSKSAIVLSYVNVQAADVLRAERKDKASQLAMLNRLLLQDMSLSQSLYLSTQNDKLPDWEESAGIAMDGIEGFVGFGRAPTASTIWLIRKTSDAEGLFDRLTKRGFTQSGTGTAGNLVLTSPKINRTNPSLYISDPWISFFAANPTVVARQDMDVIQTNTPEQVKAWKLGTPSSGRAISHTLIRVALGGLEAAIGDKTTLVKVLFYSPMIGTESGVLDVMAEELTGNSGPPIDQDALAKKMLDKAKKPSPDAMPPYILAVLADIETPGVDRGVVMAFVYPDCASATTGSDRFVHRWRTVPIRRGDKSQTLAERVPSEIRTLAVDVDGLGCAATITMTRPIPANDGKLENHIYWTIDGSIMTREFLPAYFGGK